MTVSRDPVVSYGDRFPDLGDVPAMTRRLKSTPSPYEGWGEMGPDQPRLCYLCGEQVRLKGKSDRDRDGVGFRTSEPKQSWHWVCRYREWKHQIDGFGRRFV